MIPTRVSEIDVWLCMLGWACGSIVAWAACSGCAPSPPPLTPEEHIEVIETFATAERCKREGRKANSYYAYDCCMIASGLHSGAVCLDGGAHD